MIDVPKIIQTESQPTALIHLVIPKDQIQQVMGPGIGELMSTVAEQGISPTGAWFTHHLKMSPDGWDFEISVPVEKPVAASGRVKPGQRPAMKAVRTVYHGPYEGLGEAWSEFLDWIEAQGYEVKEDLWESYLQGPETGPDPARWRTELTREIAG